MQYSIPGFGNICISTIILDLNGTLSVGGRIIKGVRPRLYRLTQKGFKLVLFSGNTRGNATYFAEDLNIECITAETALEKESEANKLDPTSCAGIGNGKTDELLLKTVKLGIVTLQAEGVSTKALLNADIVVPTINDALDLFIDEERLIATLRS